MNAGLREETSEVVVVAEFTTCLSRVDVLALYCTDPWYRAVMECEPAASGRESDALPSVNVAVPSMAEPSQNTTNPVGFSEPELTAAVNVTACENIPGLGAEAKV